MQGIPQNNRIKKILSVDDAPPPTPPNHRDVRELLKKYTPLICEPRSSTVNWPFRPQSRDHVDTFICLASTSRIRSVDISCNYLYSCCVEDSFIYTHTHIVLVLSLISHDAPYLYNSHVWLYYCRACASLTWATPYLAFPFHQILSFAIHIHHVSAFIHFLDFTGVLSYTWLYGTS